MLVLSRKVGEVVTIGNSIEITVISYDRGVIRLGINAPKSIAVHRKEVYDKIAETNKESSSVEFDMLKNLLKNTEISSVGLEKNKLEHLAIHNTKKD
ncbi:MAG: carbon storage regulator CsrA [Candidatus Kapaibacterium sp.]|nr:carbon storage regulator CsrA [Ignavibacteriota bacterium]